MEAQPPHDKSHKCAVIISQFPRCKKVTLKELQSLLGLLNFACAVVKPGCASLKRLIDLTLGIRSAHHLIRLTSKAKADLRLWLSFLPKFNGKSFFLHDKWFNSHKLNLFTNASQALGFGAIFGTHWCYGRWPNEWAYTNVTPCCPLFSSVGVDYFSPIVVTSRCSEVKRYGCVLTYLEILAMGIEIHDLTTDSFIRAFTRFINRRGPPIEIQG